MGGVWSKLSESDGLYALGKCDLVVPGHCLPGVTADGDGAVPLREILAQTAILERKAGVSGAEGNDSYGAPPALVDLHFVTQARVPYSRKRSNQELAAKWEFEKVAEIAGPDFEKRWDVYKHALRRKQVSRPLRDTLFQILALWREKLADFSDSRQMLEIVDFWVTWLDGLRDVLGSETNTTTAQVEDIVERFTGNFGKAMVQRFMTGYHMSEVTDVTAEFKGGLSKAVTGLDGLMKSVLAFVGDSRHVGALTLAGHRAKASIHVQNLEKTQSSVLAVAHLNPAHMVHPSRMHTVIHEILHAVVGSEEYLRCLEYDRANRQIRDTH